MITQRCSTADARNTGETEALLALAADFQHNQPLTPVNEATEHILSTKCIRGNAPGGADRDAGGTR